MIKHIVMWKLKDFAEGKSKLDNANEIKAKLENLKGIVKEIKHLEVGINIEKSAQAFDLALYSEFDSLEDLNAYQVHPEHKKVSEFVGKVRTDRTVVDYEI
jgi:hypothetical protein